MRGRLLWPPAVPRLATRPSQSNPRGSGPEVLKRDRGHVTAWRSLGPSSVMTWRKTLAFEVWVGDGGFLRWWPPSTNVGGSFNLFMATTGDVWIIPCFRIWNYVLHVDHVSCVIMNCGQHQWVIPSPLSIALQALLEENTTRKVISLSLDLFFKILLFNCLVQNQIW